MFIPSLCLIIILIIKKISCWCEKATPFKRNNNCTETMCTDSELKNETCIIDNNIIKDQWITSIIKISSVKFSNIDIMRTNKNELIIESSTYPDDGKRVFFGFKSNGRYYYKNQRYDMAVSYQREETFNILLNLTNNLTYKEYLLSVAKGNGTTEIFDIENNIIIVNDSIFESFGTNIYSYRNTFIELYPNENGTINYLFSYVKKNNDNTKNITFLKMFLSISGNKLKITKKNKLTKYTKDVKITSCINTKNGYIVCFYVSIKPSLYLIVLNNNLEEKNSLTLVDNITGYENSFTKCINFRDNIGVFVNFVLWNGNQIWLQMRLRTIEDDGSLTITVVNKDYEPGRFYDYNYNIRMNDLIKVNDWRFCMCSTNQNKDKIYISCFTVEENFTNLYPVPFSINIKQLYDFKIFQDMRIQLFNDFIVLGFSYCNGDSCSTTDDLYYSGITILSYSNNTDILYDVVDNFCENDDFIYDNITFNLSDKIKIENNLFGFKLDSIKITKIPDNTKFNITSYLDGNIITKNKELNYKTSLIKIDFIDNNYTCSNYILEFVSIACPLEFNSFKDYTYSIEQGNEQLYKRKEENKKYYGRTGYLTIYFKNIEDNKCNNSETKINFKENNKYTIEYQKEDINKILNINIIKETDEDTEEIKEEKIEEEINEKIEEEEEINEKEFITEIKEKGIDIEIKGEGSSSLDDENTQCTVTQILNNKCKSSDIGDNQLKEIYENLKDKVSQWNSSEDSTIIETNNVIFQISSLDDQKNTKLNLSYVDLGECENILKNAYGISSQQSLIILKTDIISNDTNGRYVQYEIYNPNNYEKLDLSLCKNIKIEINIPVSLDSETKSAYDNAKNQGYNLFDPEDAFYNDLCTPYTSENDTDLTIAYRQNYLYKSLCQDGCVFNEYNQDNHRVSCNCDAQVNSTKTSLSNIEFYSSFLFNSFFNTIKISNFIVVRCYKLFFSLKDFFKNIGKILMFILYITYIVIMVLCIVKKDKQLLDFMMTMLNYKFHIYNPNENLQKKQLDVNNKINHSVKKILNQNKTKKGEKKFENDGKSSITHKKEYNPPIRKKNENKKKRKTGKNYISANKSVFNLPIGYKRDMALNESSKVAFNKSTFKSLNKSRIDKKEESSISSKLVYLKHNHKKNPLKIIQKQKQLNNYEFNYLTYKEALNLDNRTFMKFYFTLLKQKQIILFAFLPENDYNLHYMKVLIFILSFSLYFTINAFFFVDDTMDKINLYSGKFNFLFNLPQIIYSSIITTVVTITLRNLALSMKNILSIKKSKNLKKAKEKCKEIKKEINAKFIVFFIIGNILMLYFFYYISCFCSVYRNTQIILIKDTLLSFAVSMLYPFGTCLIPGIFRFISLSDKNKNRECLYKLSNFIIIFL